MPGRVPERERVCYFLGAGFSSAFGLPNTTVLLTGVHELANKNGLTIGPRLRQAYRFFYPEESATFVPEVVDFFSVLRAYEDVAKGMPGGFRDSTLLTDLKLAITRMLCEEVRSVPMPAGGWPALEVVLTPGNVVITTNWDIFLEWYARQKAIPLRLAGEPADNVVTLIKLHGSIDWALRTELRATNVAYPPLRELQNAVRPYSLGLRPADKVVRIPALENMNRNWQFIKARCQRPHMIVMAAAVVRVSTMTSTAVRQIGPACAIRSPRSPWIWRAPRSLGGSWCPECATTTSCPAAIAARVAATPSGPVPPMKGDRIADRGYVAQGVIGLDSSSSSWRAFTITD